MRYLVCKSNAAATRSAYELLFTARYLIVRDLLFLTEYRLQYQPEDNDNYTPDDVVQKKGDIGKCVTVEDDRLCSDRRPEYSRCSYSFYIKGCQKNPKDRPVEKRADNVDKLDKIFRKARQHGKHHCKKRPENGKDP